MQIPPVGFIENEIGAPGGMQKFDSPANGALPNPKWNGPTNAWLCEMAMIIGSQSSELEAANCLVNALSKKGFTQALCTKLFHSFSIRVMPSEHEIASTKTWFRLLCNAHRSLCISLY